MMRVDCFCSRVSVKRVARALRTCRRCASHSEAAATARGKEHTR